MIALNDYKEFLIDVNKHPVIKYSFLIVSIIAIPLFFVIHGIEGFISALICMVIAHLFANLVLIIIFTYDLRKYT